MGERKLPRGGKPLKNVENFGHAVRGVRKMLKGTELGEDFDRALENRGWLKNGKLRGKAAR